MRIKRGPRFKRSAKRVNHAGICVRTIQDGRNEALIELRFCQNTIHSFIANTLLHLCDARGAWVRRVAYGNRTGGGEIKIHLEILIRIVEHYKPSATHWIQHGGDLGAQRFQLLACGGGIGKIRTRVVRIRSRELPSNHVQPRARIGRRQPGMRIMGPMVMSRVIVVPVIIMS